MGYINLSAKSPFKRGKNKDFLSELYTLTDIGDFYQYFSKEI
jgi:hypothetical protein